MKIIFLDFDGVLNSRIYDREKSDSDGNIDVTRLSLIKKCIDRTDAKIVLSTSWRTHWDKNEDLCDEVGREINEIFLKYGISIYDKTKVLEGGERKLEIEEYVKRNNIASFVIVDDMLLGWGDYNDRVVRTNYMIGRGFEEKHIEMIAEILDKEIDL